MSGDVSKVLSAAITLKNEGNAFFKDANYKMAIEKYTEAIRVCPPRESQQMAIFYQNRAAAYDALKQWQKVVEDCAEALKLNPKYDKAFDRRSKAYRALGQFQECLNYSFIRCSKEFTANEEYIEAHEKLLLEYSIEEGKRFYSQREYKLPDGVVRAHFEMFEKNGFIDGKVDNAVLADKVCEFQKQSNDVECKAKIDAIQGTVEFLKLNYSKAEEYFLQVVDAGVENKDLKIYSLIMLALCNFHAMLMSHCDERDTTLITKVSNFFEEAIKLDPNNGDIYFHRSPFIDYLNRGNQIPTIEELKKCISCSPNNVAAKAKLLYWMSLKAVKEGNEQKMKKIVNDFRALLSVNPTSKQAIVHFMASLMDMYKTEKMEQCLAFVLEINTNDVDLLLIKALINYYMKMKSSPDLSKLIACFTAVVNVDESCQLAHEFLAYHYALIMQYSKALQHMERALHLARSEKECMNLIRMKSLTKQMEALVASMNSEVLVLVSATSRYVTLSEGSFLYLTTNWYMRYFYNGFPLDCYYKAKYPNFDNVDIPWYSLI